MMIKCNVRFEKRLREWDGFGVNYVAAAQTRDYRQWPQDYGSFGLLSEEDRQNMVDLIFGDEGLKPSIGKMFIDPLQAGMTKPEEVNPDPFVLNMDIYDNTTTTRWMRYFWREGYRRIKARGEDLKLIATLYGPAPWMTKQKIVRGRDLDPTEKYETAKYMIAFVKHMREEVGLPIKYISLHNEGGIEEMHRWPEDGGDTPAYQGADYNMIWPVEQVVDFVGFMGQMLKKFGLDDVGMANGECTVLPETVKYVQAIMSEKQAMQNYALMSSHGFRGSFTSQPIEVAREKKPGFHGWVTSDSWGKMDIDFLVNIHQHIYASKINGYIPWALIQRHSQWRGGDPNPGTAFLVSDDGKWSIQRGYYLYKHYCSAGIAGMAVVETSSNSEDIMVSAFAANNTGNPDAAIVINRGAKMAELSLSVTGTVHSEFTCFLTHGSMNYEKQPNSAVIGGKISLSVPPQGVVTIKGIEG